jgi:hypothetical protein
VPEVLASVLPLAPPQAVSPRDRTAATAAYFAIERRFITTSFGFQGWRERPAGLQMHLYICSGSDHREIKQT